jgi:hypothetical protein
MFPAITSLLKVFRGEFEEYQNMRDIPILQLLTEQIERWQLFSHFLIPGFLVFDQ